MGNVITELVLLGEKSETFTDGMLGFKVISEVDIFAGVVNTVVATEVCDWTEEFVVSGTGVILEVDVKMFVVSGIQQNSSVRVCTCTYIQINTESRFITWTWSFT